MPDSHGKTLRLSALYAVGNLTRRGIHVILLPVYTAYLTKADFGIIALLTVSGGVLAMLIVTPLLKGGLARFYYHPDFRDKKGVLVFNIAALLVLLTGAVSAIWLAAAKGIASTLLGDVGHRDLVRLYALVLLLWPISMLQLALMNLLQMGRLFVFICFVEAVVTAAVVTVGLTYLKLGVAAVILGSIAGMAATALLGLPVLLKRARFRLQPGILSRPLGFGCPLLPEGLSRLVMQVGDRYVLRLLVPLGRIGLYSLGYGLAEVIDTAIGTPVYDGVNPTIRKLEHDPPRQRRFIRSSATMYYLLAVFAGLVLALYSREVVMLLATNREFWPCWVIIPVVTFAFVQQALAPFLDWGMIMRNKPYHISGVLVASAAVNIALNFLLIPRYDIMGAAVATLVSYMLWNVLKGYYSWKFYDLRLDLRRLAHITLLGVGVYLLSLVIAKWDSLWLNIVIKALLACCFVALCYTTGVLTAEHKVRIRDFFRRVRTDGLRVAIESLRTPAQEAD